MRTRSDIVSLLKKRKPAYSLPREFYVDEDVFQIDLETIWYRNWLFVAPTCDLPKAGHYVTSQVGDHKVIVVRGDDGDIRAFHNSCRHRGSLICKDDKGVSPNLTCPYHLWTYNLKGDLLFAREMGDDFNPNAHGLHSVHCRTASGMIYICLADDAPDFDAFAEKSAAYLAPHDLENSKVAFESKIIEEGNWKLVWENNRECYHCDANHPALCRTFPADPGAMGNSGGDDLSDGLDAHVTRCEAVGAPSKFYIEPGGAWRMVRMALEGDSYTLDGQVAVTKANSSFPFADAGALLLFNYPSTWNHFLGDHCLLFRVTPLSATRTEVCTRWLVHKDAQEGVDYDLERLTAVWLATNDEDREIVEGNQRGILSPAYQPGPYAPREEAGVIQFTNWYAQTLIDRLPHDSTREKPAKDTAEVVTLDSYKNTGDRVDVGRQNQGRLDGHKAVWTDDELLECCSVVPEAPNVVTASFISPSGALFDFEPGQFLTLELPTPSGVIWRTYTISSSPSRPMSISVTVKAQPESTGSAWIVQALKPGMSIRAKGPAGCFILPRQTKDKYLFITAGSGITPALSMTTYLFDRGTDTDVVFVNCAKRPSELISRGMLEQMAARVPGIKLHFLIEEDDPFQVWSGYRGYFNQIMLGLMAGDYLERKIYCCGPTPFMQAVRDVLNSLGFDMNNYFQESFGEPQVKPIDIDDHDDVVPDADASAQVVFLSSGVELACRETETILSVAKKAGLNPASSCNMGICGVCKLKKVSGEVHMVHNGGISEDDIENGYILSCCSHPIGKVAVEL